MDRSDRVDGVRLLRTLVRPVALEPPESQRQATGILGTGLNIIEGHFDDKLGTIRVSSTRVDTHPAVLP
jgi:hypothetical protein